jgi:hypothetical protein
MGRRIHGSGNGNNAIIERFSAVLAEKKEEQKPHSAHS